MKNRAFTQPAKALLPQEALKRYFAQVQLATPTTEHVALGDAFGRVLAARIKADDAYPSAPRSTMDGFALLAASTPGRLRLEAEAMRIATGGVLPDRTDAVVPIEEVEVDGSFVHVGRRIVTGDFVVPRGADMQAGESVLEPGRRIGSPELGVLAALGVVEVPVYRRPIVAIVSSGDEIVAPSQRPAPGESRDSNRYAIAGSLLAIGAQVRHYPTVRDRPGDLDAVLTQALDECDAVVVSGGSSVGDRDLTPAAIAAQGDPGIIVHGLRVRPGRPTLLAAADGKPILGLPGNPASALIMLETVCAPILCALTGAAVPVHVEDASLAAPLHGREGWIWYVPVRLAQRIAHPLPIHSFSVSLAARASGYVCVGEQEIEYPAGATVRVHHFHAGGA